VPNLGERVRLARPFFIQFGVISNRAGPVTVLSGCGSHQPPNLKRTPRCGGFVPQSNRKWTSPEFRQFDSPEEVWDHYKDKGTPEQRARLLKLLSEFRDADKLTDKRVIGRRA